ncbi:spore-associated protein A [Nonomuraea sp. NPDC001699]
MITKEATGETVLNLKRKATLALASAAMLVGSVAVSGPANAASSPIAACGGGSYHVIDQHSLSGGAIIYLLYNGTYNCVVTWKTGSSAGSPSNMGAFLQRKSDEKSVSDRGSYSYYAGPVKLAASGTCIIWGGFAFGSYASWYSAWSHCG